MRVALHVSVAMAIAMSAGLTQGLAQERPILEVVKGNDTGGIIPWSCEAEVMAKELAANHCRYHGKFPRITSVHRQYGNYISFNCLWRRDIDRIAMPEVRTRSTCIVRADQPRLSPRVSVRY